MPSMVAEAKIPAQQTRGRKGSVRRSGLKHPVSWIGSPSPKRESYRIGSPDTRGSTPTGEFARARPRIQIPMMTTQAPGSPEHAKELHSYVTQIVDEVEQAIMERASRTCGAHG